jgi:hypothetical protein
MKRIAVLLSVALFFVNPEAGMAIDRTITFFSEVNGLLVDANGTPQGGIRIERSWQRSPEDEPTVDETVTSPNGTFSFPAATGRRSVVGRLPGTPVIRQEITAFGPDGPVTLWKAVKTNTDPNGELHGRPLNLECRIGVEPDGEGPVWGTCREAPVPISASAESEPEELVLAWQWPAGRPVETRLLVRLEKVDPVQRGLLGRIANSPSLTGSLPDPHVITGTVVYGPPAFQGHQVSLRAPGTEAVSLTVGEVAALGLIGEGRVCVCIVQAPDGTPGEQAVWIESWSCE